MFVLKDKTMLTTKKHTNTYKKAIPLGGRGYESLEAAYTDTALLLLVNPRHLKK